MIPAAGVLSPATRQQHRRVARGSVRCSRCHHVIVPGQPVGFDDGKDAHLECSKARNEALDEARQEMAAQESRQRASEMGLASAKASLWTPPPSHETPLDLSKAHLLSPIG